MINKKNSSKGEDEEFFKSIGVELVSYEEYQRNPHKYGRFSGTLPKDKQTRIRNITNRFSLKKKK